MSATRRIERRRGGQPSGFLFLALNSHFSQFAFIHSLFRVFSQSEAGHHPAEVTKTTKPQQISRSSTEDGYSFNGDA